MQQLIPCYRTGIWLWYHYWEIPSFYSTDQCWSQMFSVGQSCSIKTRMTNVLCSRTQRSKWRCSSSLPRTVCSTFSKGIECHQFQVCISSLSRTARAGSQALGIECRSTDGLFLKHPYSHGKPHHITSRMHWQPKMFGISSRVVSKTINPTPSILC